jgi:hypothetical protein
MSQQHAQETNVVKTIFFREQIQNGEVTITINQQDADLTTGRWRFCIQTLVIFCEKDVEEKAVTVTISTNSQHLVIRDRFSTVGATVLGNVPARILLTVLMCRQDKPYPIPSNNHWLEMSRPSNSIQLGILDANTDMPDFSGHLQGILLLQRVAHS